ncbi:MAG: efflux RND transporter periplasmic adaptor subunit [Bacteroidota bacterium]
MNHLYKHILFTLPLFIVACNSASKEIATESTSAETNTITLSKEQFKNAGIEIGSISSRTISETIKANGKIDVPPQNMVSISVPLGGYLKYTKLLPGTHVNKGDVLAVLEDPQYIQIQQDYLVAGAQLASIESEYQRQLELNKNKSISDKVFEQTRANYQTQKITIQALSEKLKLIGINPQKLNENSLSRSVNILSPINGYTTKINANIGKYINPNDILFELVDPSDIHLNLNIYEKDLHKLYTDQPLVAFNNTHPEIKHKCKILLIAKDINDGIAEVHCHFDAYDKQLAPGMYMNAEIEIQNKAANVLPEDAIVRHEGKYYIFESTGNNTFEMRQVEIGVTNENFTEILSTDFEKKQIVTKGAYTLLMTLMNKAEEE